MLGLHQFGWVSKSWDKHENSLLQCTSWTVNGSINCIVQDPVTGSAHCILGPYWATKYDKYDLLAHQVCHMFVEHITAVFLLKDFHQRFDKSVNHKFMRFQLIQFASTFCYVTVVSVLVRQLYLPALLLMFAVSSWGTLEKPLNQIDCDLEGKVVGSNHEVFSMELVSLAATKRPVYWADSVQHSLNC